MSRDMDTVLITGLVCIGFCTLLCGALLVCVWRIVSVTARTSAQLGLIAERAIEHYTYATNLDAALHLEVKREQEEEAARHERDSPPVPKRRKLGDFV